MKISNHPRIEYVTNDLRRDLNWSQKDQYQFLLQCKGYIGHKEKQANFIKSSPVHKKKGHWYIDARAIRPHLSHFSKCEPYYEIHHPEIPITLKELEGWIMKSRIFKRLRLIQLIGMPAIPLLYKFLYPQDQRFILDRELFHARHPDAVYWTLRKMNSVEVLKQINTSYLDQVYARSKDEVYAELEKDWRDDDWSEETRNYVVRNNHIYTFDYFDPNIVERTILQK